MISVIEALQASGLYSFTRADLRDKLEISDGALKSFISRQVKGGRAVHLRRGYYSVVPAEYLNIHFSRIAMRMQNVTECVTLWKRIAWGR